MHLGLALHRYGVPAHRLEEALDQVARRFGVASHFLSAPTYIMASFGDAGSQQVFVARANQGEMNLEKLSRLDALTHEVIRGSVTPHAAYHQVDAIIAAPRRFHGVPLVASYALASAAVARLFDGGWREIAVAAVIGTGIGLFAALAARAPPLGRIFELVAAVLSALLAAMAARYVGGLAPPIATLAGLIVLVPGMVLTTAMTELATGHLVSGTSRLMAAAMTFLKLGFGAVLGAHVSGLLWGAVPLAATTEAPGWTLWPALLLAALALAIILQAPPRQLGWVLANAALGYAASRVAMGAAGGEVGPFAAAFLVTAAGNVYARVLDRAATVIQAPATLLLVPGSIGYRSVAALLDRNPLTGLQTAFSMGLAAIGLVSGILLANLLLPARKIL